MKEPFEGVGMGGMIGPEGTPAMAEFGVTQNLDPVNLQMVLMTSSVNHEYARHAFEKTQSYEQRQALLERMEHLKSLYFAARGRLASTHPERLESLERELQFQKQAAFHDQVLN